MAMPTEIRPLRRVEYDRLVELGAFAGERVELLEGRLITMSPAGPRHSSVVQKLTEILLPALIGRATVRVQSPFGASETSEPEPDIAVVPLGSYETQHPTEAHLIIEVADSSVGRDRSAKHRIYAGAGVPEYWIVNFAERCIEVHREPRQNEYGRVERVEHGEAVRVPKFGDIEVRVSDLMGAEERA